MCVDWRKALRSLWRVDPRTHSDLITAVSNQIPLIFKSEMYIYIKCISACLITSNCIVKIITEIAICNPMSCSGDTYRELLDGQGTFFSNLYLYTTALSVLFCVNKDIIIIIISRNSDVLQKLWQHRNSVMLQKC